ncbi:MAG: LptF/LptG family permease, partial [Bacteroidia bacterium]|nr:LptF/LptG family permease [Bacteroidia bacterium]
TPADFIRNEKSMENMTTSDLREHIRREQERGIGAAKNFMVQLHQRNAGPFSILILTLIGVSISSRKVRGGMGLHLALGVTIGAAYVVLSQFSSTFSINMSMSPMLGAWLPNIIFTVIALVLIRLSQK